MADSWMDEIHVYFLSEKYGGGVNYSYRNMLKDAQAFCAANSIEFPKEGLVEDIDYKVDDVDEDPRMECDDEADYYDYIEPYCHRRISGGQWD